MRLAAILLPLAALLTLGAAAPQPPRERCATPGRTPEHYCTMLFFDYDSAAVVPSAWPILDRVITEIEDNEGAKVVLAGYTDAMRYPESAVALSRRMAESVRDHLVQHGVDPGTITIEAYGSADPRVPNVRGKAEPLNRRVEVWVIE